MKPFSKLVFIACSSEAIDENKYTHKPGTIVKVLDLVNSEKIADTPSLKLNTHIIHKENLFPVGDKSIYTLEFQVFS